MLTDEERLRIAESRAQALLEEVWTLRGAVSDLQEEHRRWRDDEISRLRDEVERLHEQIFARRAEEIDLRREIAHLRARDTV